MTNPATRLTTARLRLRAVTGADVDLLVKLDSDPEVRRYLFREPPPRDVVELRIIPALIREYTRTPGFGRWLAFDQTADFVGWFGLRTRDDPANATVGYRLVRSAWGQGLATEGCRALIALAFGELAVTRVTAQTMAVNTRSRAVMERCGMHHVRTFHEHFDDPPPGTDEGEVEYEITLRDWTDQLAAAQDVS